MSEVANGVGQSTFYGYDLADRMTQVTWPGGGVYHLDYLLKEYFPFLPLMMFPEAFITGMLTTLAVVFYPQWVLTFDDAKYLK